MQGLGLNHSCRCDGERLRPRPAAAAVRRAAPAAATRRPLAPRRRSQRGGPPCAAAGDVCLVTGASQGIGSCIALELAKAGCRVAVNYRNADNRADAEAVAEAVRAAGGDALIVAADMADREQIEAMHAAVVEAWGTVDVLVNNAGITRDTLVARMKPDQWQSVIDINLSAVFYNMQAALKTMGKKKKGRIVNIASVVGIVGNAGQANYSAAKAGVIGLTKTVAREYAARGITANAVAPGFIQTAMTAAIDEKYQGDIIKNIPAGRMGTPEEVAGLVAYLALHPSAAYITGKCIAIDGGMTM